jgi:hypothetical protein
VAKAVLKSALAEEVTGHLGCEKHDPAGGFNMRIIARNYTSVTAEGDA